MVSRNGDNFQINEPQPEFDEDEVSVFVAGVVHRVVQSVVHIVVYTLHHVVSDSAGPLARVWRGRGQCERGGVSIAPTL